MMAKTHRERWGGAEEAQMTETKVAELLGEQKALEGDDGSKKHHTTSNTGGSARKEYKGQKPGAGNPTNEQGVANRTVGEEKTNNIMCVKSV